ncbi:class I SAM-dependent methyltransferase [Candidatus Nitrospira allomarina]|uniref:Class I SAM-dependent methyltransferase n=1 Tax=Candidatus Nitrospira allomarina TaxID=3020900 RepID=A0AA96GDY9_9BACT|nr:class I SAM-dependent methyltransferase [Candidatus Nitrospira allomarina]WNM56974.1 class I SAM-dependent methyltransferase [Candidatus Nitrospira allomarina]
MRYKREEISDYHAELFPYLLSWGLREFHDEASYYEWQRETLSKEELCDFQRLIDHRYGGEDGKGDIDFYDELAHRDFIPVLYSQRFHYFLTVGNSVCGRIAPANQALDFGCGIGILTIFFAQQHPDIEFLGIDRSSRSIEVACFEAEKRRIRNVRFEVSQVPQQQISGTYDLILSTHALFQAEREPGLPSQTWKTFQRACDLQRQKQLEVLTGIQERLDALLRTLGPMGRMILFEKTWNLGRRILFQRALDARGVFPISSPVFCRYWSVDEEVFDGPLYEVARLSQGVKPFEWDEEPYREPGETLYRCIGIAAERMGQELVKGKVTASITGVHSNLGTWMFRFGLWKEIVVWGLCEHSSGLTGLIVGGEADRELLYQLVETVTHITESDFQQLVHDFWGNMIHAPEDLSLPCYENHHSSAQIIYEGLPSKCIQQETTCQDGGGREMHIELGTTTQLTYLYCANTFDQRQLVLIDEGRAQVLYEYYRESLQRPPGPPA